MSILDQHRKPIVDFDPSNPQHVEIIRKVIARESIADAPVRFAYQPPFTSGVTQAIHKMAEQWISHILPVKPSTQNVYIVPLRHKDG